MSRAATEGPEVIIPALQTKLGALTLEQRLRSIKAILQDESEREMSRAATEGPEVIIAEHPDFPGDWSIHIPALARWIGRWGTHEDARRAAARMGFQLNTNMETAQ